MRIVVMGASRLGVALVTELLGCDHDVILVDVSRDRLDDVSERLDCGFIEGDGALPQTLRDAFGDGADALLAMTNHDDVNILSAVVARSVGFKRVILQIVRSELLDVCEELGLDEVVTPHATVARSIARSVESEESVWTRLGIAEDLHFATYAASKDMIGTAMHDLDLGEDVRAMAIKRPSGDIILSPEARIEDGDEVLVGALSDAGGELEKLFDAGGTDQ